MLVEAVVIWNSSSAAAHDNGLAQVNGCLLLGGETIVNGDAAAFDAQAFTVQCAGGMLDDLWCMNGTGPAMCFFLPTAEAVVETTDVAPETAAAQEQPTEPIPTEATPTEPAPTPSPTATMPAMPTEVPAEPTVVPTSGDGLWLPPHFDDLPPLEPAEPAPSPTPAPLT